MKHRVQQGFTLVELMVSITIGIFIIGAAMYVLQGTSGINRQVSEVTQLRQQAAFAFRIMAKQVREAGAIEPMWSTDTASYRFNKTYAWFGGSPLSNWIPPTGSLPDTLNISLQNPAAGNVYTRNCLGQSISGGNRSYFYVRNNNLRCTAGGASNQDQPIIENVNGFSVKYRVSNGAGKQFVAQTAVTDWTKVDAVEICLDLIGSSPAPTNGANYIDCNGASKSLGNRIHVVERTLIGVHTGRI